MWRPSLWNPNNDYVGDNDWVTDLVAADEFNHAGKSANTDVVA
jgi:hypothetical protein